MPVVDFDSRLHHTGFVVPSIAGAIEGICRSLGAKEWSETWHDPLQRVRVAFVYSHHPGEASLELVEPAGPNSPVEKHLERGGGLHHLCYEVNDFDQAVGRASERGLIMVQRPRPAVAFSGRRIAWFLTPERLLLEYLERLT
jgi:methylmalonyl-CoA/ethylmalonyl-CoA epimerase